MSRPQPTSGWRFLDRDLALVIHEEILAAHGGRVGIVSEAALASAILHPRDVQREEPRSDVGRLAAACASGFIRSHPFVHGKKRVGLLAMEFFLTENGYDLTARDEDCFILIEQFANREIDEEALAAWVRGNIQPRDLRRS
ncbi:MAG: type II toxin-antitoxin system death-on-curing family toxin [Methylocystis sp.]|nr:MAG: type II toxin-antitoxin system death-on-curing family toxin [Methylocystis sp.]